MLKALKSWAFRTTAIQSTHFVANEIAFSLPIQIRKTSLSNGSAPAVIIHSNVTFAARFSPPSRIRRARVVKMISAIKFPAIATRRNMKTRQIKFTNWRIHQAVGLWGVNESSKGKVFISSLVHFSSRLFSWSFVTQILLISRSAGWQRERENQHEGN